MVPVVLGILIALALNEWRESVNDRKFLENVVSSINREMEENQSEFHEKIEQHQALLDSIQLYMHEEDISIGDIIGKVGGIKAVSVKNTAWRSFINPNIELVDYELISLLTDIEETKQVMKLQVEKLMDFLYERAGSTEYDDKMIFQLIMGDLTYSEESLLEDHEAFLARTKGAF